MINLYSAQIEKLYCNKVGNKSRNENLFISKEPLNLDDEYTSLMKEFFLKSFREKEHKFYNISEDKNLYTVLRKPFDVETNRGIAQHLYNCSNHQHVKPGELFVTELSNVICNDKNVKAVGIFKSELKNDFLKFDTDEDQYKFEIDQGVNLSKLDKGLLVIFDEDRNIDRVLIHDSNRYDTKYWFQNFAQVHELQDESFETRNYLKFCEDFSKEIPDSRDRVEYVNDTHNHFASTDHFEEQVYLNETIPHYADHFAEYKAQEGHKYGIENTQDFDVVNTVVSESIKKGALEINLDTGITIKIKKGTPAARYITKCFSHEEQTYYYKVKFNKEL